MALGDNLPAVALPSLSGLNLTAIGLNSQGETLLGRRGIDGGVQLRILPLGASITYGYESTDGNGYRFGLRNQLVYNGNAVNMIGSVQSGTMVDNDVEGWPGYVIDQVAGKAELSIPSQPNLVLINAGTNDCIQNIDIANAHVRLGKMVDRLLSAIPGVTVICSTLLPNGNAAAEANVKLFNAQLPAMVANYQAANEKVLLVDFHTSFFSLSDIRTDGTHPTDAGYQKMAAVWYQGIQAAAAANWLTAPAAVAGLSDIVVGGNTCQKRPGNAIGPVKTQQGSGFDDGRYVHTGVNVGTMTGFAGNTDAAGVYWADINGDGIDDYVYVDTNANLGFGVSLSSGGGVFGAYAHFALDIYCLRRGVRFADMTGDGRDDFCCLAPNGDLACWENTPGSDPRNPTWVSMGIIFPNRGYLQAQVRLADIDGDGRADYVAFSYDGTSILGWRNGAPGHVKPQYWNPMSGVFSGLPNLTPLSGWRFVDLNGDHRDDLVHVSTNGQVTTWINQRGYDVGLTPVWVPMGQTHAGAASPQNISFGTFWGSGRGDYSEISESGGAISINRFSNEDVGGTMVKGDGVRYCDMRGTGADDYIWISSTGEMWLYGNKHAPPNWIQYGIIGNVNRPRKETSTAMEDATFCSSIKLPDLQQCSRTTGTATKFTFTNIGVVSGGATPCTQGYGYTNNDLGVRFADIDGDGKADYLCLELNGRMTGALNRGLNNLVNQGQIKLSEAKEREHIWLADINGDGRADYLFVDSLSGAVTAWTNEGNTAQSGSSFSWINRGIVAVGYSARGSCINFGNLYGVGRADYIIVNPQANTANTYFNVCPDGGLTPETPELPVVTVPGPAPPNGGGGGSGSGIFDQKTSDPNCASIYDCINCATPDDPKQGNDVRWKAANVDSFWPTANDWYTNAMDDPDSLGVLVGRYAEAMIDHWGGSHAPLGWDCATIGESPCTVVVGQADILSKASDIVTTFSPSVDVSGSPFDTILTVAGYLDDLLGFAGANFWSKVIKDPNTFTKFSDGVEKAGTYNANVESLVTFAASYSSDQIPALEQSIIKLNALDKAIGALSDTIRGLISGYLTHIFDGSPSGMADLVQATKDGFFLTNPFEESGGETFNFPDQINDAFYAKLIPIAWKLDPDVWPVLVYLDEVDVPEDGFRLSIDFPHPLGGGRGTTSILESTRILSDDDANISRVPYGDTTLWLLDLHTCEKQGVTIVPNSCEGQVFRALPGISSVNGDGTYGSVTKENMVSSSYDGWLRNFQQNGYKMPTTGDPGSVPFSNGFATAGFF
ncbi:hypothetical protein VE04_08841, partial [Pseudogymnoascus sp. 24MN13]